MPSIPFYYEDFSNGFNTQDAPFLLDQTVIYARDMVNVQGTTSGAICKRNGNSTWVTLALMGEPYNLFAAQNPNVLITTAGTGIYKVDSAGTATLLSAATFVGLPWSFVQVPVIAGQGPIFGVNGADPPFRTDGTPAGSGAWTNTSGAISVPNGKYCVYHQNQVFIAGTTAVAPGMGAAPDPTSRLYWSAIADPTNWDPASLKGAGFMDFDPNDGEAITGLGVVGKDLLVCKPNKLWLLVDAGTATSRQLSVNVGCASPRSIVASPQGTFFLSQDRGVYVTNGSKLTPVSDKILPTIYNPSQLGLPARADACGAYFNAHYYLSIGQTFAGVPSAGSMTLDFDTKLNSWWKHSFFSHQFAVWHPTGIPASDAALFSAAPQTGAISPRIDQCFVRSIWQDNGTNFQWSWTGPWQSPTFYRRRRFPTPYFRKRFRQLRINGAGTVDLSTAFDMASETTVATNIFGGAPFAAPVWTRLDNLGVGNEWAIRFSGTSNTQDLVTGYMMAVTDRRDLVVA